MKISSIALFLFLGLWVTRQPGVLAEISPEIHKICSDTKDYLGCVNAHGQPPQAPDGKRRWERDDGDIVKFDPKSVKAINMNGGFGRYLIYRYVLRTYDAGSRGVNVPGYQMPSTATTNVIGNTAFTRINPGAVVGGISIPGRPGGPVAKNWTVQADCRDYTADWDGDGEGWSKLSIETNRSATKEARAILDEFCPQMERMVKEASNS
jgi:hypothetical protein